jgi:hypothetical protein
MAPTFLNPANKKCVIPYSENGEIHLFRREISYSPFLFSIPQPPYSDALCRKIAVSAAKKRERRIRRRDCAIRYHLKNPSLNGCSNWKERRKTNNADRQNANIARAIVVNLIEDPD